jgi:hypothetical protein
LGGPKVRDHWEDLGIDGRITLSWTLGSRDRGKLDLAGLGFCEHHPAPWSE